MSATLHLAGPEDLDRLDPMVAACHAATGPALDEAARRAALLPLLEGSPHGVVYLIGMRRAPIGYIAISFGHSIASGGIEGRVDEFFVRENVRRRGIGSEALGKLLPALRDNGVRALRAELPGPDDGARRIFARAGFALREGYCLLRTKG